MSTNMIDGKGMLVWQGRNIAKGDPQKLLEICQEMKLSWVGLKIGDDTDQRTASYPGAMIETVHRLRAGGLKVWGWHYIYGGVMVSKSGKYYADGPSPALEADFAKATVNALGLDGYIIDAEKEFKGMAQGPRAKIFVDRLRGIGVPVALCSYRFPSLHPEFPWAEFLAGTDLHMPQVYWGPGKAVSDLDRSLTELTGKRSLPMAPVGRAYIGDGHPDPAPAELTAFMTRAQDRGMPGVSFWAMDFLYLHAGGQERQQAITNYNWGNQPPAPVGWPQVIGHITVSAATLNVRQGPGTSYADLGDLIQGTGWFYYRKEGAWVMIGDGCWVMTGEGLANDDR